MKKIKICYVMSFIDFSQQYVEIDELLDSEKYEPSYVFLSPRKPALYDILKKRNREVFFIEYHSRKNLPSAVFKLYEIFGKLKPEIVHTHLVDAALAALVAAVARRIKKRVQTRHHSMENHVYFPHGVYYDKFINRLSTKIAAVSGVVAEVLTKRENTAPEKVTVIEHGFNFENYNVSEENVARLKQLYELEGRFPIVGAISRFVHGKGVQYLIPAFEKLLADFPNAKLVLANARGDYSEQILEQLKSIDEKNYVLIDFEKDILSLYKTFDIFLHIPINRDFEAFGQTYVEALAMGIPSVFTLSGIAGEFIKDRENALVVPFSDADAAYEAMKTLLNDAALRSRISKQGKTDVFKRFGIKDMVAKLDSLYSGL